MIGTDQAVQPAVRQLQRAAPNQRRRITQALTYIGLIGISAIMILPLAFMVRSSLMSVGQIFRFPLEWIPNPWKWENYAEAFRAAPFLQYFWNTLVIIVVAVTGTVITSILAAFGFARTRWPGRNLVFGVLLSTLMLPYVVTLIPTFLAWSRLGAINTIAPLTLPSWFGGGIFNIFLLRQFFQTIPRELDEAAYIDGANPLQVLWYVIVPNSYPALITVVIFATLYHWNDFLGPIIYLTDPNKLTIAVGLNQFKGLYNSQWHLLMAASTMALIPVIVMFFFAQRFFIKGITLTGIKG